MKPKWVYRLSLIASIAFVIWYGRLLWQLGQLGHGQHMNLHDDQFYYLISWNSIQPVLALAIIVVLLVLRSAAAFWYYLLIAASNLVTLSFSFTSQENGFLFIFAFALVFCIPALILGYLVKTRELGNGRFRF